MSREDELEYINEKLKIFDPKLKSDEFIFLSRFVESGQKAVRDFAKEHLLAHNQQEDDATKLSSCVVSQRDIQRVFILYRWLLKSFNICQKYLNENKLQKSMRAMFIACALTYYFRLNEAYRKLFEEKMNAIQKLRLSRLKPTFKQALDDEMNWLLDKMSINGRIARTNALKENIYAIVICTMTKIPLIIIGPPGSSKTLSFKIVVSNFQGSASTTKEFREQQVYKIFDPYPYQCSRHSTSMEIESVFDRAINRQETLQQAGIECCSVVLLDEAGLPEEKHESLKALHYHLDKQKVFKFMHAFILVSVFFLILGFFCCYLKSCFRCCKI